MSDPWYESFYAKRTSGTSNILNCVHHCPGLMINDIISRTHTNWYFAMNFRAISYMQRQCYFFFVQTAVRHTVPVPPPHFICSGNGALPIYSSRWLPAWLPCQAFGTQFTKGSLGYLSSMYFSTCGWICIHSPILCCYVFVLVLGSLPTKARVLFTNQEFCWNHIHIYIYTI